MDDKLYIGIDVSKNWIDIAAHGANKVSRLANTPAAIADWAGGLAQARTGLICFEPTGGYERVLRRCLSAAGLPHARVHPNEVVAFRRARGIKAKTDPMDARLLAAFCALELAGRGLAGAIDGDETLRALSVRRRQLVRFRQAESCRLASADGAAAQNSGRCLIEALNLSVAGIEADIAAHIAGDARLRVMAGNLRSLKGVGPVTAHTLLGELPELGHLTGKQIAALVGLAPRQNDSGKHRGRATTGHGRPGVRQVLFNAARAAIVHNPAMREAYRRLTEVNNRAGKVALTAIMRRMLVILNAIARDNEPWKGAETSKPRGPEPRSAIAADKGPARATVQSLAAAGPLSAAMAGSPCITSRDAIQDAEDADPTPGSAEIVAIPLSRDEIQGGTMPRGRKPNGERTMTGAERQALYRARQTREAAPADAPAPMPRGKAAKVSRPQRWNAALGELKALIGEYENWYETMPEHLRDTPTGQALEAIMDLDLEAMETIQLPKGFGRD